MPLKFSICLLTNWPFSFPILIAVVVNIILAVVCEEAVRKASVMPGG
jgi:hypothetical protein